MYFGMGTSGMTEGMREGLDTIDGFELARGSATLVLTVEEIPEPSTSSLMGLGLLAAFGLGRLGIRHRFTPGGSCPWLQ